MKGLLKSGGWSIFQGRTFRAMCPALQLPAIGRNGLLGPSFICQRTYIFHFIIFVLWTFTRNQHRLFSSP